MKIFHIAACVLALALNTQAAHAQLLLISPFGNNATEDGSWTYTPLTSVLSTPSEGFGDSLGGTSQTVDLGTDRFVSLTLNATTAPSAGHSFTIALRDSVNNIATATFNWSDFSIGSDATVTKALSFTTFDFANVTQWSLVSGGSSQALNVKLVNLSAVPEASTYALLLIGLSLLWSVNLRRRRPSIG